MRYSTVAAAAALTLLTVSASLHGQNADTPVNPRSMALLEKGRAQNSRYPASAVVYEVSQAARVPYGCYVVVKDHIRFETEEYADAASAVMNSVPFE